MESSTDPVHATVAAYDALAPEYSRSVASVEMSKHLDWFLKAMQSRNPVVLDVGCGAGRDLAAVERFGVLAVGVDLSVGMLKEASRTTSAPLVRGDVRKLPFSTGLISGAWCCAVLVHLAEDHVSSALSELRRVLNPRSPLFLSLRTNGANGWQQFGAQRRWYVHHTLEGARLLIQEAGFEIRHIGTERDAASRDSVRWIAARAISR